MYITMFICILQYSCIIIILDDTLISDNYIIINNYILVININIGNMFIALNTPKIEISKKN